MLRHYVHAPASRLIELILDDGTTIFVRSPHQSHIAKKDYRKKSRMKLIIDKKQITGEKIDKVSL